MKKKAGMFFAMMAVWLLTMFAAKETVLAAETEQPEEFAVIDEGTCGESLGWRLEEDGVLLIGGTGAMTDYEEPEKALEPQALTEEENDENTEGEYDPFVYINKAPWGKYYDVITQVIIDEGVTSVGTWSFCNCYNIKNIFFRSETDVLEIGEAAFLYCENLISVDIPDSTVYIGKEAFAGCYSLEEIELPESLNGISEALFSACYALKEITIPETVTAIEQCAFEYCDGLEEVIIPDRVTELGASAFEGCSNLKNVVLPKGINSINAALFENCTSLTAITIPENVKSIGWSAFYLCDGLSEIVIPENVEIIDGYAFYGCDGLQEIIIPENVKTLGKYAFYSCSSLQKLDLRGKITSCGSSVFSFCKNLTEVSIAEGIIVIGDSMFSFCNGLKEIVIPDTVTSIGESAFEYCTRMSDGSDVNTGQVTFTWQEIEKCTGLESVALSKNITSIGEDAFAHCFKLSSIEIPDSVKEIKDRAFKSCFTLKEIDIGNSVETIGEQAFATCSRLEGMVLPDTLKSIGKQAFAKCELIEEIELPENVSAIYEETFWECKKLHKITFSEKVRTIEANAFLSCSTLEKVYYGGTNAQWKEMSIIEEGNETFLDALIYCSDGPLGLLEKNDSAVPELGEIEEEYPLEITWHTEEEFPMEGMPLVASNVYMYIDLNEQFREKYANLFYEENGKTYLSVVVYLWDSEGNRVAQISNPVASYDGYRIKAYICTDMSTLGENIMYWEKDTFLPNQTLEVQIRNLEQKLLVSIETQTLSFERFSFTNFEKKVPDELVEDVLGRAKAKNLQSEKSEIGSKGVCFGISLVTSLVNYGSISAANFENCTVLDQVRRETKMPNITNIKNAEELIMLGQMIQYMPSVQAALEASQSYRIDKLLQAIDYYKRGEAAMPIIYIKYKLEAENEKQQHALAAENEKQQHALAAENEKQQHALAAYDYKVVEDGYQILVYENNYGLYEINDIEIYDCSENSFKWSYYIGDHYDFKWFVPAADGLVNYIHDDTTFKALMHTEKSMWPSFNGVENQMIAWIASAGEELSTEETEGQFTWVWGDGTVSLEKQTEDVSLADDYALYTVKAAEFVEFTLQNGNAAETAIEGAGELQESCEYSTEAGDVVVEFTGISDDKVKMKYFGTTVEFTGIKEGVVTVTYEDGRVWSKTIGTDGESGAILYADGTNQPTDSNGEIWADKPVDPPVVEESEVVRISGTTRYETGYKVADALKAELGVEKFDAIVVATGKNFADALAGSYLAVRKNAPIILTNGKDDNVAVLHEYIEANVQTDGTVYILGGDAAVPATVETIDGYDVVRLSGKSRYETNLAILAEAGIEGDELIVATGKTFADSLSASAVKLPILLVKPGTALTDEAKAIAEGMNKFYIIGGEGAVSTDIAAELAAYGEVIRVFGKTRYETSVAVANTFFENVEEAVVASGKNFPDGLCGGPLAVAMNAPLILTADGKTEAAVEYVAANAIEAGFVLGGTGALADESVADVFSLGNAKEIVSR